jgi:membrane-associated protease RseP (regulator of RpoE activity)
MWYGGAIMIILLAHEMGHYLMCRKYHVNATLPYFIPFPLTPFGTLGAVIRMQAMLPSRKALFDVAVAGPLAGLFFTIPAIFWGAKLSTFEPFTGETGGVIYLAEPFFFSKIVELSIGSPLEGQNMAIHPLAYAGWAGLFVTALNLLPIGQLDGGHVIYALFGRQHGVVATIALICFALITIFVFHGWILMLALLIFFGRKHPPTLDERPIDLKRKIIGFMMMAIFLLSFAPEPIKFLD